MYKLGRKLLRGCGFPPVARACRRGWDGVTRGTRQARVVRDCSLTFLRAYLAREQTPFDASVLKAGRITTAWAAGRHDLAPAAWRDAGENIDPQWLELCKLGDCDVIEPDLRVLAERDKQRRVRAIPILAR